MTLGLILLFSVTSGALSQIQQSESLLVYATRPTHGVTNYDAATMARITDNGPLMDLFADLLTGRLRTELPWVPAIALWWLAQNGDSKYIPIFLEWADQPDYDMGDQFAMNAHGLAVHAADTRVRSKVLELAATRPAERKWLVGTLLLVNDVPARSMLIEMQARGYVADRATLVEAVLAAPARASRPERIGCTGSEVFSRSGSGPFGCIEQGGEQ